MGRQTKTRETGTNKESDPIWLNFNGAEKRAMVTVESGRAGDNNTAPSAPSAEGAKECVEIKEFLWTNHSDLTSLPAVMALFALIYTCIIVTAVLGNLLVVVSVIRHKYLHSVRNLFIVSLSVSDIVVSVVSGTITPFSAFSKIWLFGELLCKLVPIVQGASLCFSTLTLTAISIDRFRLIVTPLRRSIQKRCACRIVAFNSGMALVISLPILLKQKLEAYETAGIKFCGEFCAEDWGDEEVSRSVYGTLVFFVQFVIPFFIISTCYVMISIKINSGILTKRASTEMAKFGDQKGSTPRSGKHNSVVEENALLLNNSRRDRSISGGTGDVLQLALEQKKAALNRRLRTNKMLIAMVAVFFCCWAPSVVFNFLRDYQWLPAFVLNQEYLFGILTHVISMSSTVWNPVLYALLNEQFRTAFSEQFRQLRTCTAVTSPQRRYSSRMGEMNSTANTRMSIANVRIISAIGPPSVAFEPSFGR